MSQQPASPHPWQSDFHVILVQPEESRNVGAVARAMGNFGFSQLRLAGISADFSAAGAKKSACWSANLLDRVEIHPSLKAAIGPMQHVAAFSPRHGKNRPEPVNLVDWAASAEIGRPTALVFGPESRGLSGAEVLVADTVVSIPVTTENPSLNLAQAVLIVLYELCRAREFSGLQVDRPERVPFEGLGTLRDLLREAMSSSGFLGTGTPPDVPELLEHRLLSPHPSPRELSLLLGFFGRIVRSLKRRNS